MTTPFYIVAAFVLLVGLAFAAPALLKDPPLDIDLMMEALRQTENTPRAYVGRAGERSEWQIRREVWIANSHQPFEWASSSLVPAREETKCVVRAHIEWIKWQLEAAKMPRDPYNVALVWTAGLNATKLMNFSAAKHDYALRAANIYYELQRKRFSGPQNHEQTFP